MYAKKTNKKSVLLLILALALAVAAIAGTVAWLTATDSETNTFTIGAIDEPEDGPTSPVDPTVPNGPENPKEYNPQEDGYIFEPYWDDEQEIAPGGDYAKDPYVGVGAGSEKAYIFVEVENSFESNSVYFKLNTGWTAVENQCVSITIDSETYYVSGIFTYDEAIGGSNEEAWTSTPVFSYVSVSDNATYKDLAGAEYAEGDAETNTIVINAFIHQAVDGNNANISKDTAQAAAIAHFTATP